MSTTPGNELAAEVPTGDSDPTRPPSADEVRKLIRLLQCRACSHLLRSPFTLPCGRTVCKGCMPGSHQRTNISFFATSDRVQGLWCPLPDCQKEHAAGDCSPDVVLGRILGVVEAEFEKAIAEAQGTETATHVVVKDQWEATGVPSLREPESTSMLLGGGRLLATYALAKKEELKYDGEVTYVGDLTESQAKSDLRVFEAVKEAARTEADCQICYALFYEAVTTPCGHTFCRACLHRVLDHAKYCPVCRRPMSMQPLLNAEGSPPNQLLSSIISFFWSDLLAERRQTVISEGLRDGDREYDIPVFVCALSFPAMPTFLHVFEPRYRLMIRRALQGDRCFGMVLGDGGGFMKLGTLLRIVNVEFFPDGRSLVETVGASRFRIIDHGTLDGYVVAKIQRIDDMSVAEEEELEARETAETRNSEYRTEHELDRQTSPDPTRFPRSMDDILRTSTTDLMAFGVDFIRRMREHGAPWLTARVLHIYGECPDDPAVFPWWLAVVLPVRDAEKYRLLGTTSVRERLKMCSRWILEWEERESW
ncbi:ATP-dependent protease [Echria macrotheca]|uniref:ATP-dependent protease n=1 Tax=Echria macrotheca TaxID=438768 RepID=A0AAJ0B314_9PEZI|nr:ATP-dependent protease [Echria macrotheca]